jgi:hypothetical protein
LPGCFAFVVFAVAAGLLACDMTGPFGVPPFQPPLFEKAGDDAMDTAMINAAVAVAAFNI